MNNIKNTVAPISARPVLLLTIVSDRRSRFSMHAIDVDFNILRQQASGVPSLPFDKVRDKMRGAAVGSRATRRFEVCTAR